MSRRKGDHVVMGCNSVRCLYCGREQAIAMPCSIAVMAAVCKAYAKDHRDCEPTEAGRARWRYSTPREWRTSWDTGTSALTIYATLAGTGFVARPGIPYDLDDFGRCFRLVEVGQWHGRVGEVAEHYPEWLPFARAWGELCLAYIELLGVHTPGTCKRCGLRDGSPLRELPCVDWGRAAAFNDRLRELRS